MDKNLKVKTEEVIMNPTTEELEEVFVDKVFDSEVDEKRSCENCGQVDASDGCHACSSEAKWLWIPRIKLSEGEKALIARQHDHETVEECYECNDSKPRPSQLWMELAEGTVNAAAKPINPCDDLRPIIAGIRQMYLDQAERQFKEHVAALVSEFGIMGNP